MNPGCYNSGRQDAKAYKFGNFVNSHQRGVHLCLVIMNFRNLLNSGIEKAAKCVKINFYNQIQQTITIITKHFETFTSFNRIEIV